MLVLSIYSIEPAVSFLETRITVQESQTRDIFDQFKIQRTGTDLQNSTVVCVYN